MPLTEIYHLFNCLCATSKGLYAQSDQSLYEWREYSMSVKLLTEYNLEFLSLKGDYTGSSGSSLVKMRHCWKSHVTAQMWKCQIRENCCCKPLKASLLVIIRLLAHLSQSLLGSLEDGTRSGFRASARASVRSHFQTWISQTPAVWMLSNFIRSINGVGKRLHYVFGQIGRELWFPWQQIHMGFNSVTVRGDSWKLSMMLYERVTGALWFP